MGGGVQGRACVRERSPSLQARCGLYSTDQALEGTPGVRQSFVHCYNPGREAKILENNHQFLLRLLLWETVFLIRTRSKGVTPEWAGRKGIQGLSTGEGSPGARIPFLGNLDCCGNPCPVPCGEGTAMGTQILYQLLTSNQSPLRE